MPLATSLRPENLEAFIGQEHLVGNNGPIKKFIEAGKIPSMIFWGPPGSGKTTLAEIISKTSGYHFVRLSAVTDGKDALKKVIASISNDKKTILFIDEIHRWSKLQQDALLPHVESGDITLIGATTENPSFTVISPLLSRARVFVFNPHTPENINSALKKASEYLKLEADDEAISFLSDVSNGDLRFALNTLEIAKNTSKDNKVSKSDIEAASQKFLMYDKNGEEHYNIISAVHKSLRSSNATAGVYWVSRMLVAGEDPLYVARRLIRFASEDIGNANPNALLLANVVYDTCSKIGMPECEVALIQLAEYLANSVKNNSAYTASQLAKEDIKRTGNLPVPTHLRNAPTKLMKELGYGKGYQYDHNLKTKKSDQQCMPDGLTERDYFKKS
jgi:putative ATPase